MATGSQTERNGPQGAPDIEAEDVRQGQTTGHIRWVLRISLALAVLGLAVAGTWFAVQSPASYAPHPTASTQPH